MTLRVVGELLDLDPDVAGVAFEGLAIVVGTFGEVSEYGATVGRSPLIPVESYFVTSLELDDALSWNISTSTTRDIIRRKIGHRSIVGKLSCIADRRRVHVVVLSNLPREIVLSVHGDALQEAMS